MRDSDLARAGNATAAEFTKKLSVALSVLLLVAYALGLLSSLKTHRELFAGAEHGETGETMPPIGVALGTLAVVTLCVRW